MNPSPFLQLALSTYALGAAGSLAALRRERVAAGFGFGCATIGGVLGYQVVPFEPSALDGVAAGIACDGCPPLTRPARPI